MQITNTITTFAWVGSRQTFVSKPCLIKPVVVTTCFRFCCSFLNVYLNKNILAGYWLLNKKKRRIPKCRHCILNQVEVHSDNLRTCCQIKQTLKKFFSDLKQIQRNFDEATRAFFSQNLIEGVVIADELFTSKFTIARSIENASFGKPMPSTSLHSTTARSF